MSQPESTDTLAAPSHSMLHRAQANVKAFGATGDGVADDTVEIQAAVDALGTAGGTLLFPPGTYLVSSPGIVLPGAPSADWVNLHVVGYGATITATTAISMMKRATPVDMSDASMLHRFVIEGMRFLGNSTTGQIGLDIFNTYGMVVQDCAFETCDIGFRQTFCLMSRTESCFDKACKTYGFEARSANGLWSGAGLANTPSNLATFKSCRSYGSAGEVAQFYIHGSANVRLEDCVTEGGNPVNAIHHDDEGGTTSKFFSIKNHHSENTPSNSVILSASMGHVEVDGLWHQTAGKMIDATGSNNSAFFHVKNLVWTPGTFKTTGTVGWHFEFPGSGGEANINTAAYWDGGAIPSNLTVWHIVASGMAMTTQGFRVRGNQGGGGGALHVYADGDDTQPFFNFSTSFGGSLSIGPGGSTAADLLVRRIASAVLGISGIAGTGGGVEFTENGTTDLGAGAVNTARLYCRDNGAGKTQLCVRFNTGAVQVIATEP